MLFEQAQRICVVVCTPMAHGPGPDGRMRLKPISPRFQRARSNLSTGTNINVCEVHVDGLEIGAARSVVAARCLGMSPRPQYLLFVDSDVLVPYDALTKLMWRAKLFPDHDVFAGVYCAKFINPGEPLVYTDLGQGPFVDWAVGDVLTTESHGIKSVGMGLTLIRVSLFQKLLDAGVVDGDGTDQDGRPFFKTVNTRSDDGPLRLQVGTEDIYFCDAAVRAGAKICVDTSVFAGHVDDSTDVVYGLPADFGPAARARWLSHPTKGVPDVEDARAKGLKLAVDIGAGGERRHWEGHVTYTLDARREAHPDYCHPVPPINLPDGHYDLVASSHSFEHVGRWDQEALWAEVFRVCKPGGRIEIVVPNLAWAVEKMREGQLDEHVVNVLYGAQEQHGYDRRWNVHYFGYTPAVGRALAEQAGFADVTTEGWRERAELGYNLVIRGTKPPPGAPATPELPAAAVAEQLLLGPARAAVAAALAALCGTPGANHAPPTTDADPAGPTPAGGLCPTAGGDLPPDRDRPGDRGDRPGEPPGDRGGPAGRGDAGAAAG